MITSVVVRLLSDSLALGALVGEVEDVVTGLRTPFRDADELLAALQRTLDPLGLLPPQSLGNESSPSA